MNEGMNGPASEREHYRALTQFLLYHNNYRSIPWLDGNTPLQKLKSFDGYAPLHSFCPLDESDAQHGIPDIRRVEYKKERVLSE